MLLRVQELNSFAKVIGENRSIDNLTDDFFADFSVILLTDCTEAQAIRINKICRQRTPNTVFFWSDMFGDEGLFYSDFGAKFSYKEDKQPGSNSSGGSGTSDSNSTDGGKTGQKVKEISFPPLETVLAKKWTEVVSRHFPLSRTFVQHRLLVAFWYVSSDRNVFFVLFWAAGSDFV